MKLKFISSGILIIISLFKNSYQVQLNSKSKIEFPIDSASSFLGGITESIKNGPIGGALMIPVSLINNKLKCYLIKIFKNL